jgi:hypothetical protein
VHPYCEIAALDRGRADMLGVGVALNRLFLCTDAFVPKALGVLVGHFFFPKTGEPILSVFQSKKS